MRVQQHRRGIRIGGGPRPHDGAAAVGRGLEARVGEAELGEPVAHPLGRLRALLGRELAGVGDGPHGDELGELGAHAIHQLTDTSAQVVAHPFAESVVSRLSTNCWKSSNWSGQYTSMIASWPCSTLLSTMTGRSPEPPAPVVSIP